MTRGSLRFDDVHLNELLSTVGVGTWDWDLATGKVIYSAAWGHILGYTLAELPQTVKTWERMVLPEDLLSANAQIDLHLSGKKPIYEAEFRMVCKDGHIIWAQDKGQVIEYDEAGNAVRFMGVLQNVSRLKDVELRLLENQESLDLAVSVAELGTWDWDIPGDFIRYNNEYLTMLGYTQDDMTGSMEEWEDMNHPEDLITSSMLLADYLEGRADSYTCEIRMKHRDGRYIWTRDVGRIVARDATGAPIRLIGGHLNINELKTSEEKLTEALEALAYNNFHLESEVENRTKELKEQERLLWTVNQISRKLLTFNADGKFEDLVQDCLCLLGKSIKQSRVYIWRDHRGEDGRNYCTQMYEWVCGVLAIQDHAELTTILYDDLPSFEKAINSDSCLNSLIRDLSTREQEILGDKQGIKTILIAPIAINGVRWGFIGVDDCNNEVLFTSIEESMLLTSGSLLGSTIGKMETAAKLHEMEERTQIMLDATPLCCNLWTEEFQNMSCNEEAVRLFGLSSQKEYLARFHELSPIYQPSGRLSSEVALEQIKCAFRDGYSRFNWLHQRLDGTPIPAEITLVRIKYKDSFIVAGYTRDLREFNAMLAALQSKEYDLRTARDEALLSSKAKTNFLANMSHEIRTPMNAIAGLAEIILRESSNDKTAQQAMGIKSACSNLLNIINDILDISKIESGKLEIYNSQYELASLLNDVITICRMRLGKKPLMFVTYIDSRVPAQLVGDEIRIKQILINFIGNAIKFTEEGSITLRVSATVEGERATLRFSVRDSGVGIKQEDLHRLFAEFERVNTTKNRNIEGTGLGLAISKQLCEMMNGHIEVESVYGVGSEFIAYIPQECLTYEPISQIEKNKSVLLYEPRDLYRHSVEESLKNLGCNCIVCTNQSELYDFIRIMHYDYILAPALHLEKVKSLIDKLGLSVSVAILADQQEEINDNTVPTLSLPVSCLQLANLLNGHFEEERHLRHNATTIHFTAPTARVLVVDDNMVNLHVAEGLMAPYQFTIDTAINGLEAVTMVQKAQYDLVFMDHMMPEMDGIDATVAIRQLSGDYYNKLPIVALTANALVGTREMFIREGMNDFLAKPIEMKKLTQVLLKWLPKEKIINELEPKKIETHSISFKIEGIHTAQGILAVGGNEDNYLQILATFYADCKEKCISLLRHAQAKDITAFRTEVHAVKSTSATIGALEISGMAAKLETAALENDSVYIDENLDDFLNELSVLLEGIRPELATEEITACHNPTHDRGEGDMAVLRGVLPTLYDAIEFANIAQIEKSMDQLEENFWSEMVAKELLSIRNYLAVYDYDGALGCVERLKEHD